MLFSVIIVPVQIKDDDHTFIGVVCDKIVHETSVLRRESRVFFYILLTSLCGYIEP